MKENYDTSIHSNPDAKAWAEFFVKAIKEVAATRRDTERSTAGWRAFIPNIVLDEEYMLGWFANAMMAMHDHLAPRLIKSIDPDSKEAREAAQKGDAHQQGGDHYARLQTTPWDLIKAMDSSGDAYVDYARGDIIAYVARMKNGLPGLAVDLRKAAHCANEAASRLEARFAEGEEETPGTKMARENRTEANNLTPEDRDVHIKRAMEIINARDHDKIGAYMNADSIRYDWGEDDKPVRAPKTTLQKVTEILDEELEKSPEWQRAMRVLQEHNPLLEGTSPLCPHAMNFEACDRCWDREKADRFDDEFEPTGAYLSPFQLAPGGYGGVFRDLPNAPVKPSIWWEWAEQVKFRGPYGDLGHRFFGIEHANLPTLTSYAASK